MNWSDLIVIAIIAGFAIIGMMKGFLLSIFRLVSFFVSIFVSIKFYPLLAGVLQKTELYTNIKASLLKNLLLQQQSQMPEINRQAKSAAADAIINNLHLPGFLKDGLVKQLPELSKLVNVNQIMDSISGILANMVIDVISLVLLYVLVRVALIFLKFVLQGIAKLPVFKQMDKVGGLAFGAVEGLLTIYIVLAVIMLFHASPQFKSVFESINTSIIAKFFYQNNFIVDWMFPQGKVI